MPVGLPVLGFYMPFQGVDPHTIILPGPPPVPVVLPEGVGGLLATITPGKRNAVKVATPCGDAIGRGHDVGPPPVSVMLHIPPIVDPLYPLVIASSSSKSQFGVSSVKLGTHNGVFPIAVSILGPAGGLQQDCGDIGPMVSFQCGLAMVVTAFNNSVQAGFTLADLVGSIAQIVADNLFAMALSFAFGLVGKEVLTALKVVFNEVIEGLLAILVQWIFFKEVDFEVGQLIPGLQPSNIFSDGPFALGHALGEKLFGDP